MEERHAPARHRVSMWHSSEVDSKESSTYFLPPYSFFFVDRFGFWFVFWAARVNGSVPYHT